MAEYVGVIEKIESLWDEGGETFIRLTITITKPIRPIPPARNYSVDDEWYRKEREVYESRLKEYKEQLRNFYGFRIGEVKLIQDLEEEQE